MEPRTTSRWAGALLVAALAVACGGGTGPVVPPGDGGVDATLPDGAPAPCVDNGPCAAGAYCAGAGCGTLGACAARPALCPDVHDPACGCDGRTHGNACEAAAAGTRVARRGACEAVDGGPGACAANDDCDDDDYCAGAGCDAPGYCAPRPLGCPRIYAPVCGCDGATHANDCVAHAAGVRVARDGACEGARCAALADCGAGRECVYPASGCATAGACVAQAHCVRAETYCACSGETYHACRPDRPTRSLGPCDAGACGVACDPGTACCEAPGALYYGRCYDLRCVGCCETRPIPCSDAAACPPGTYCGGGRCGAPGWCMPRPTACDAVYDPVCGCDGRTYANGCAANAAGVRVATTGPCAARDGGIDGGR